MKFKDYKPKYSKIELVESSSDYRVFKLIDFNKFNHLIKKYGEREILSVRDYEDTHTTLIIILKGGK